MDVSNPVKMRHKEIETEGNDACTTSPGKARAAACLFFYNRPVSKSTSRISSTKPKPPLGLSGVSSFEGLPGSSLEGRAFSRFATWITKDFYLKLGQAIRLSMAFASQ